MVTCFSVLSIHRYAQLNSSASFCSECAAGTFAIEGSRQCTSCDPGLAVKSSHTTNLMSLPFSMQAGICPLLINRRVWHARLAPSRINRAALSVSNALVCWVSQRLVSRNISFSLPLAFMLAGSFQAYDARSACDLCRAGSFVSSLGLYSLNSIELSLCSILNRICCCNWIDIWSVQARVRVYVALLAVSAHKTELWNAILVDWANLFQRRVGENKLSIVTCASQNMSIQSMSFVAL